MSLENARRAIGMQPSGSSSSKNSAQEHTPWCATDKLLHAEIITSFMPLEYPKIGESVSKHIAKNLRNLYPGDKVYIFETLAVNEKLTWARGYVVIQPLPADFISASVDIKKLPEDKVYTCIFPLNCAKVLSHSELEMTVGQENSMFESFDEFDDSLSFTESEFSTSSSKTKRQVRPQLPMSDSIVSNNLSDEIKLTLKTISSTLFAVYSKNRFDFFEKLVKIYYELDDLRLNLQNDLLTKHETELAKQKVILLLSKFAKLSASGGGLINRSKHSKSDIDGKESIIARDEKTAELYQFPEKSNGIVNPGKIAQNQLLSSLSPHYISSSHVNFVSPKNTKFVESTPSNIVVDFKEVVGSSFILPKGYAGMKAYMYLRNQKKRLTEAFCISINSDQKLQIDNLAAALFTNIPANEVEGGKIYLVAILTENININENNNSPLKVIRKGLSAGVADISRIFSHKKGHLVSGQSHRFQIKLFSSFMDGQKQEVKLFAGMNQMMAKSLTLVNNGWGELIDRIISGSSKGVAVNPRAEKLILSIKELKLSDYNKSILSIISGGNGNFNNVAWSGVPSLLYNPLEEEVEKLILKLSKVVNKGMKLQSNNFITVHVRASSPDICFSKGKNEELLSSWKFLSVSPDESVEEMIVVRNLPTTINSGKDYLIFDLFVDRNYVGCSKYLLRSGSEIYDTGITSRTPASVDFNVNNSVIATAEIMLEYVGKTFNQDHVVQSVLNWKSVFGTDLVKNEITFIEALGKLKRLKLSALIRHFSKFCFELLCMYDLASSSNLPDLKKAVFEALIHLLDVSIARNREYVSLFEDMLNEFGSFVPKLGEKLMSSVSKIFSDFKQEWNASGRALCRTSYLILKLASKCIGNHEEYKTQVLLFASSINGFLSSNAEIVLPDQLLILETLELYLDIFGPYFEIRDLIKFVIEWTGANKLKGLGILEDANATALINKKRNREHSFLINKLIFINRLVNTPDYYRGDPKDVELFINSALDMILSIFRDDSIDMECSRLALGIYLSLVNATFGQDKVYLDTSEHLYILLIRLLPFLSESFDKYRKYCSSNGFFKKKRTFTYLFQSSFPFTEHTMDSIVTDVTLVELLVEFEIIVIYTAKVFDYYRDTFYKTDNPNFGIYSDLLSKFGVPDITSFESLNSILRMTERMISSNFYPSSWLSLRSIALQGSYLLIDLVTPFLPTPNGENISLWNLYIRLMLKASTSKPVALEHLEPTARKGCLELTTDLRTKIAPMIGTAWNSLGLPLSEANKARFRIEVCGGYQGPVLSFNDYELLKRLMLFILQRNSECLSVGIMIYWTIIANELIEKDTLFEFEKHAVISLYGIFENDLTYSPKSLEIENLVTSIQTVTTKMDKEDEDYSEVVRFAKIIARYLASLVQLDQVPNGEEFDDDRAFHRLSISSFLMNVDRPELFQGFICDMYGNYLEKKNYVQAALSLELLANTWEWDVDVYLPECHRPKLPSQTAFKRKVDLFKIIASNFVKGNKLEQAVDIYNEMLEAYTKFNFDLSGLSFCHTELGKLYGQLENVDRLESTFFKISFIGSGFPESIRSKEFIYEGLPYEHITSVHSRLNRLYPGSRIISNEDEANKLLVDIPFGKFLFIKTVSPKKESYNGKLSFMAKQYIDNKNLNTFMNTRRLPGATGIHNLWTEEITYQTYMTFPTLMNRSEIKFTTVVKIPPIKNAIKSLMLKTDELVNLEYLICQNLKDNIKLSSIASSSMFNSVSRILAGTVDSPVNGGASQFKIFLSKDSKVYIGESEEEYAEDCDKLKECYDELIKAMNRLLKFHGLIIPGSLKLQHDSLVELFSKNFKEEIEELQLDVSSTLDYNELMSSLTSTNIYSKQRNNQSSSAFNSNSNSSFNKFAFMNSSSSIHGSNSRRYSSVPSHHSSHHGSHHSHHGSHHASRHGSVFAIQRTAAHLTGNSRFSARDDESTVSYMDESISRQSQSMNKSSKKNLLNYN